MRLLKESAFSLSPCAHPQEAVPRERLIPWRKSWGPLIPHLQVSILFGEGTGDGRVRSQGSHHTSGSAFCPVSPQGPPHPVPEPGTLLLEVLQPLQGPRAPAPRYQAFLCVCGTVGTQGGMCVYTGFGARSVQRRSYSGLAQHLGFLFTGPCASSWPQLRNCSCIWHVLRPGPVCLLTHRALRGAITHFCTNMFIPRNLHT